MVVTYEISKAVGYYRSRPGESEASELALWLQREAVRREIENGGYELVAEFTEREGEAGSEAYPAFVAAVRAALGCRQRDGVLDAVLIIGSHAAIGTGEPFPWPDVEGGNELAYLWADNDLAPPPSEPAIVVFVGAGGSRESGPADRDPAMQPNAVHHALARLGSEFPGPVVVVTEAVDDLHERAGSRSVIHLHGERAKARCLRCGEASAFEGAGLVHAPCPACGGVGLRSDVVRLGETPLRRDEVEWWLTADCHAFVAVGTDGQQQPAAGFAELARAHGARTLALNPVPSGLAGCDEARHGALAEIVPAWVEETIADWVEVLGSAPVEQPDG